MKLIQKLSVWGLLIICGAAAQAQVAEDFVSADGLCDAREYEDLAQFPVRGNSVTVNAQQMKSGSLAALPMTDAVIPPFTPVKCFAQSDDLILVLSEEGGQNFCGWIPRSSLLRSAISDAGDAIDTGLDVFGDRFVCPTVRPMTVTQYCHKVEQIGDYEPLCDEVRNADGGFRQNPIETKFLTWNANESGSGDRTVVPLFSEPDPGARMDTDLSVFSIMRVWDVAMGGNSLYALVGPDQKSVVGWVPASAGTVWFSKLTAFFSADNAAPILTAEPGTSGADKLGERPPNLIDMLNSNEDFDKYPVLIDRRDASELQGTTQEPHLKIAFIGAACDDGQICSETSDESVTDRIQLLEAVDILFLIDATKSMEDYFAIVANAVNTVAGERASTTTRFGAAMYGDFLSRDDQSLSAPIQFHSAIELTEIFSGDEFDTLPDEDLYITDPSYDPTRDSDEGKPEAAFAALFQAIKTADWRDESVRFVIHVADHGDRGNADDALVELMRTERIFYLPIAVRGEYMEQYNRDFVEQSEDLLSRLTVGDATLGIPTQVTFEGGAAQTNDAALRSILKSLRAATEIQDVISAEVTALLLGREVSSAASSNRYPAGFAQLTAAARALYEIEAGDIEDSIERRTLAAPGFIAISESGVTPDWEFQVALAPRDLSLLIQNFDLLCKSMNDSDAQNDLSSALRNVIEILTGDVLSTDNTRFYAYFDRRDEIPLVTRTILGEGILDLGRDMNSFSAEAAQRVESYRREACRTSKLLKLMDSDRLVERPFESGDDGSEGDLIWDANSQTYNDMRSKPFTWTQIGLYDVQTIYLPLKYLPRPYADR